ncbi:MAG: hypothetical protein PHS57_03755 [Alphaproteobacteria bacterium]|nr:hypothetical protein [Alphaproteobacteria bacterium]
MLRSTDYLELIVQKDARIYFEKGAPYTTLKRDVISIRDKGGKPLIIETLSGFSTNLLELPREIFDDFAKETLIEEDERKNDNNLIIFRSSDEGKIRGHSRQSLLVAIADYIQDNWASFVRKVPSLSSDEREMKRSNIMNLAENFRTFANLPTTTELPRAEIENTINDLNGEGVFLLPWHITALANHR